MSAGHTPGPWHVGQGKDARIIYDERGWAIADAKLFPGNRSEGEDYANARLMAAAPELLRCLQALMYWDNGKSEYAEARAALAAATEEPT